MSLTVGLRGSRCLDSRHMPGVGLGQRLIGTSCRGTSAGALRVNARDSDLCPEESLHDGISCRKELRF